MSKTGPFVSAWRHRTLLTRLMMRDVEARYRGSLLGRTWAVVIPIIMIGIYTFTFGQVIRPQWQIAVQSGPELALIYFAGLVLFDFFMECLARAPDLIIGNVSYVKKVVFPLEILAWVVVGGALFRLGIGLGLLLALSIALHGVPPLGALQLPLVIVPLALFSAGLVWLIAAISVYVRDVRHTMGAVVPILMFLSPVFFPLAAAPPHAIPFFYLNPLTFPIETTRGALFGGAWISFWGLVIYSVASVAFAKICYGAFARLRRGFADVL